MGTPDRLGHAASFADRLRIHPIILPTVDSSVRIGFEVGLRPQIVAEVEDMAMMRLLAREDIGLAVLPPIVVKDEIAAGALMEGDQMPDIVETFHAVTVSHRFPNPLVRLLLQPAATSGDLEFHPIFHESRRPKARADRTWSVQ
ncbi:transcriptional regulator, LysR family [Xanthomonas bromi]|uniref:Transcriptional regulator, LysR family n=1 Tax=Xanthomonas bromi TaxID=56449 RepID=A0A1C3NRP8_9XANT|nr:transcriptional regulator, LysR family [Xanthomonas bromi]